MTSPSHLLPTRCRFPEGGAPRGGRASPAALELHISASSSRSLYSSRASARATQRALEISSPLHGPKRDFVTLIHSDHLKLKTSGGCFFVFLFFNLWFLLLQQQQQQQRDRLGDTGAQRARLQPAVTRDTGHYSRRSGRYFGLL